MSPIQPSVTTELPWACDNIQNPASSLVIQLPLSEETPANTDGEPTISTMLDQTTIESSSVASPIVTEEAAPHDIELSDIFGKSYYLYSIRDFMLTRCSSGRAMGIRIGMYNNTAIGFHIGLQVWTW
jgi:hypothetical protein